MCLKINFKKISDSFKFAVNGIKIIFQQEPFFRIEVLIAILITIAMFYFNLSLPEKTIVFVVIFLVLMVELVNSLFKKTLDFIHPSFDNKIKKIKDMAAGIVLLSYFIAAIVGILIFFQYLSL